jgi:transcriptional regulator with XRE-family HTH domain
MAKKPTDEAMKRAAKIFEESGDTLEELGVAMGYPKETARRGAWQFLRKTADPHLSMLRRFAKAMGISIEELVTIKAKDGARMA